MFRTPTRKQHRIRDGGLVTVTIWHAVHSYTCVFLYSVVGACKVQNKNNKNKQWRRVSSGAAVSIIHYSAQSLTHVTALGTVVEYSMRRPRSARPCQGTLRHILLRAHATQYLFQAWVQSRQTWGMRLSPTRCRFCSFLNLAGDLHINHPYQNTTITMDAR